MFSTFVIVIVSMLSPTVFKLVLTVTKSVELVSKSVDKLDAVEEIVLISPLVVSKLEARLSKEDSKESIREFRVENVELLTLSEVLRLLISESMLSVEWSE